MQVKKIVVGVFRIDILEEVKESVVSRQQEMKGTVLEDKNGIYKMCKKNKKFCTCFCLYNVL